MSKTKWKPKFNNEYYCVTTADYIGSRIWFGHCTDLIFWSFGNCFRSEEEAEKHKAEILAKFDEIKKELGYVQTPARTN